MVASIDSSRRGRMPRTDPHWPDPVRSWVRRHVDMTETRPNHRRNHAVGQHYVLSERQLLPQVPSSLGYVSTTAAWLVGVAPR